MIELDLHRAGRQELGVSDEDAEAHRAALRRVLQSWCALRPEMGYIQGLNCIAAALLVMCEHAEAETIVLLTMLVDRLPADCEPDGSTRPREPPVARSCRRLMH